MVKKELKRHKKKSKNLLLNIVVTVVSFFVTVLFTIITETVIPEVGLVIGIIIVLFIILVNILFDMVGVAFTSSNIAIFNSMSSRKAIGSKKAVSMVKKSDTVSSICNDVVGDICGVVSGVCGVVISRKLAIFLDYDLTIVSLIVTGIIAALTVGGKSIGKSTAINNSNYIVYSVASLLSSNRK